MRTPRKPSFSSSSSLHTTLPPLVPCLLFVITRLLMTIPEVTSLKSYYHGDLNLDFLCPSRSTPIYVRDVPWDCASYVMCVRGRAVHTQCPASKLFESTTRKCLETDLVDSSRCKGRLFEYLDDICAVNPQSLVPSPDSCALYLDCSAPGGPDGHRVSRDTRSGGGGGGGGGGGTGSTTEGSPSWQGQFVDRVLECPYPSLFSPATGLCDHHSFVTCRDKFLPKAPCDYLQYRQLYDCPTHNCTECTKHHPGCLQMADGYYPVPSRPDMTMKCQLERTVDIFTCPPGFRFSSSGSSGCVRA